MLNSMKPVPLAFFKRWDKEAARAKRPETDDEKLRNAFVNPKLHNETQAEYEAWALGIGRKIGSVIEFLLFFMVLPFRLLAIFITHIHAFFMLSLIGTVILFIYGIVKIRATIP